MPKARRRKAPIVSLPDVGGSSAPESTRAVIREFHILLKLRAKLQSNPRPDVKTKAELADLERQIDALGGLESYQRMSSIGQGEDRGGGSEKVFIRWLKELGVRKQKDSGKQRLLEVGALKPDNYKSCLSWIDPIAIDLRSRHPSIKEQDFLLMDEAGNREKWDLISLSLVLNFVPDPKDRGRMLNVAHSMLVSGGYLFLVLPLPCVANSRYLSFPVMKSLMEAIGFIQLQEKWRQGGKIVYWLYQKQESQKTSFEGFRKKSVLRTGHRNNFAILLNA
ncbi:putative methyltransferase-domain-containing protein [Crucibulum laeve]|uniref:25S rRNA adenine-N(1) methyltransferase n=1 Tax=Crucibulum laeve TaxID=68775 RepID=A0A5C3MNM4_9AGAR|nr:putative methyltransferase-domain-containing protein [Crucibulum laeve]